MEKIPETSSSNALKGCFSTGKKLNVKRRQTTDLSVLRISILAVTKNSYTVAGASLTLTMAFAVVELVLHRQNLLLQCTAYYLRQFTSRIFSVLYSKTLQKELSSNNTVNKMPM